MVVLSVNIYSAGSNGSLSGKPTRAVSGIGGSRPWTSWYGDIPVVLDMVMFTLKVTGASQFDHAFLIQSSGYGSEESFYGSERSLDLHIAPGIV